MLHFLLDQRHCDAGKVAAKRLKTFQQRAIQGAEEAGYALHVQNVNQLIHCPRRQLGAEGLVGQLDQRILVVRALDQAVKFCLLPAFLGGL